MQKPSIPKGTRDFGPVQVARRNYIFGVIRRVFEKFGRDWEGRRKGARARERETCIAIWLCFQKISAKRANIGSAQQETAQLEAQAYEIEQKTSLAHEVKTVLDSWVRYEGQVKQRQQQELAASIISKIDKELQNPKVLEQILKQSVADVERKCSFT